MEITIYDLYGNTVEVLLEEVGACYPDDDVIYFQGVPCRLSSARQALTAELAEVKRERDELKMMCAKAYYDIYGGVRHEIYNALGDELGVLINRDVALKAGQA